MPNSKVPVKVQKRSLFNKSHVHQLSSQVGTITPILIDEVIPNTTARLRVNLGASMPPLASDAYMKCDIALEAFFVPLRLCYGGFESWFCQRQDNYLTGDSVTRAVASMPVAEVNLGTGAVPAIKNLFGAGGLPDYLGFSNSSNMVGQFHINPLPFVAYHLVWQHFYRNPLVERECFARPADGYPFPGTDDDPYFCSSLPFTAITSSGDRIIIDSSGTGDVWKLADGYYVFSLRQRNFDFDYFTNAFPSPTLGTETKVVPSSDGSFTIAQLRLANAMADWQNTNQLAGTRYNDTLKARYGASLHDGVAQRPVCLGSARYNVYNKSMMATASNNGPASTQIPQYADYQHQAGGVFGNAYAAGSDLIIDNFTANEPGYILVNATLVPQVTYATSFDRLLTRYRSDGSLADMASARFQGVGNQPIYVYELTGQISSSEVIDSRVFGYTDRYADWMMKNDRVSGLLRSPHNLSFMVAQRSFAMGTTPYITSSFLKIPTTYLDGVFALSDNSINYGYWLECAFDYNVVMPLAQYSIPSLVDPAQEHGDTFMIHRGGFRF